MPTAVTYSGQGPRLTVNAMLVDPLMIRARMLQMMTQQFIMTALLRNAPATQSGAVVYAESNPLFATDDAAEVAEGAEIPLGQVQIGNPKVAVTRKTGLGVEITREMRDRNRIDLVQLSMDQVRNTMVRNWERRLFASFDAATAQTGMVVAGSQWSSPTLNTSAPRRDVLAATKLVTEAVAPNMDPNNQQDFFGFQPDTLVISTTAQYNLMQNSDFVQLYLGGDIADRNPNYTGQLERKLLDLDIMTSRFIAPNVSYVLQTNVLGGYSDERPLGVTPLYADLPREVWRADVVRRTAIFIDQPFAVAKIVST